MNLGASGLKQDLQFFLLAALSIVLIILESHSAMLQSTRSVMFVTIKPLIEVAQLPTKATNSIRQILEEREQLRERNRIVNQENVELRERIIQLKNEELRSKWLAELLDAKEKLQYPVLSANLKSIQLQPLSQKIVLNRGTDDRVFVGQPVIDHRGVIGQVSSTTLTDSAVTLITDANHSIPVRIQRNGIRAVVHGLGVPNQLLVSELQVNQDVRPGDILVTSGLGERFPLGYPVAEITSVVRNKNVPFAEITAIPLATLDPSFEVLMVWNNAPVESGNTPVVTMNDSGEK
jgi:rod shape-determining protein MreC